MLWFCGAVPKTLRRIPSASARMLGAIRRCRRLYSFFPQLRRTARDARERMRTHASVSARELGTALHLRDKGRVGFEHAGG